MGPLRSSDDRAERVATKGRGLDRILGVQTMPVAARDPQTTTNDDVDERRTRMKEVSSSNNKHSSAVLLTACSPMSAMVRPASHATQPFEILSKLLRSTGASE